ncbi:hypothetical protein [Acidiplasma cupricumulans]|uniref:hypothetical protein n=1 Tax=Acidiplasma cupricumulans TaxID=312540 RepID=UPI001584E24F|nr:hypothetical protein [Acidiplasma cupricumulans]
MENHQNILQTSCRENYRGPYGRPFTGVTGKKLIIGAGTGIAPLMPLVDNMTSGILSAKTKMI